MNSSLIAQIPLYLACQMLVPAKIPANLDSGLFGIPDSVSLPAEKSSTLDVLPDGTMIFPKLGVAYYLNTTHSTWFQANAQCLSSGSRLAVIDTDAKIAALGENLKIQHRYPHVWGETSGSDSGATCALFHLVDAKHMRGDCDEKRSFLCEYPIPN